MLKKKTKIIILSAMVLLLGITGYLNITLNGRVIDTGTGVTAYNYFDSYRYDRSSIREQAILYYDAIINSDNHTSEAKELAEKKQLALIDKMEIELELERLIVGLGFSDVIITSSANYINVIVKAGKLTSADVNPIVTLVRDQTDYNLRNIKIIPVE